MTSRAKPGRIGVVVATLGAEIARGQIAENATLPPEPELEARFGVSRSVVREAIKTLAAKGLVSVKPRRGTRVRPRCDWSLLDRDVLMWLTGDGGFDRDLLFALEEVRTIVEPAAASLAALRADAEDHRRIFAALAGMQSAGADAEAAVAADRDFHLAILDATHNPVLQSFRGAIDSILSAVFKLTVDWFEENLANHAAVAEAIARRDADGARAAMHQVLGTTQANLEMRHRQAGASTPRQT